MRKAVKPTPKRVTPAQREKTKGAKLPPARPRRTPEAPRTRRPVTAKTTRKVK